MKKFTRVLFVLIALSLVYPVSGNLMADDSKNEVKKCAVCGTVIAKDAPEIKTEYKGKTYYFASENCKEEFLQDPVRYTLVYEKKIEYVCKKCDYHADEPGKCPKCGKELEKQENKIAYVCPMKQCNVQTNKPGNCPKCGMKLKKTIVREHSHEHEHQHSHEHQHMH